VPRAVQRDPGEPVLKLNLRALRSPGGPGRLGLAGVLTLLAIALCSCNQGLGAFQTGVGNTPNRPPGTSFRVLGEPGLQFSAVVSDTQSTWLVRGSIPVAIVIVNNTTPVRVTATKLSASHGIMSLQLTVGFRVKFVSSTTDPYGVASLQSAQAAPGFSPPPPPANPDLRIFIKGPSGERYSGLVEDRSQGFIISDRSPTLILFDTPDGAVDATFTQIQNFGPFDIQMLLNGGVVAEAKGGPTITIRQP
jgi:hypothetical protein